MPLLMPLQQYVNEGPQPMDPKWHEQWAKICSQLQSKILGDGAAGAADGAAGSKLDALSYLFSRIGYDCGKVARGLHENRVRCSNRTLLVLLARARALSPFSLFPTLPLFLSFSRLAA